jgi:FKBP-type peptidyl-prolyl cis-trans isomerase FklB
VPFDKCVAITGHPQLVRKDGRAQPCGKKDRRDIGRGIRTHRVFLFFSPAGLTLSEKTGGLAMKCRAKAVIIAGVVLAAGVVYGADGQTLRTEKEKTSYAVGVQMGMDMKKYRMDVDPDVVAKGFRDAYTGGKLLLNDREMSQALADTEKQMAAKSAGVMKEETEKNRQEGEAFLARNRTREGVKTLPDGLQYSVMKAGAGRIPRPTDMVVVNYRGTFIDGTEFDSSYRRGQPLVFPVNRVIKGWTEALQLMRVGSKWQLFIPPQLAYGPQGAPPAIGPNETLIFELELLSIQ